MSPMACTFRTSAGHTLAATIYTPDGLSPTQVKKSVLLAPATGIRRGFYGAFAAHLAGQGYGVLSFDFQGIGGSLTGALRDCPASLVSWGEVDLPAALDELTRQFPAARPQLVGHSAGGQLVGLMPGAGRLASVLAVAGSSGQLAQMPAPYRLKAQFFMRVLIPASTLAVGYARTDLVGMGGPLPRAVGAQWARWCLGRGYVETSFGREVRTHQYDTLDLPSLWLRAADDEIAVPTNVEDMIRVFKKMAPHAQRQTLHPTDHGLPRLGHMGFFHPDARAVWPVMVAWLERHAG
ncbi:alpha/beta hydrolase family protein [Deinococcus aquaedulcis]|uniref:alpha/beta hydrolase family protein n=1 Tax=Deinococcus aquaedulcis TaxID=2840455 RepID=UPI001C83F7B7|nr:alpha/beta hydrolase [Deinococcus aquaedulcis]